MAGKSLSAEEKRWRAESDAETMARYDEIINDSSRRAAAVRVAKQRAEQLTKQAAAMTRVSGSGRTASKKTKK